MTKKLYVGSLSYSVDDGELQKLFEEVGKVVSAKVIIDSASGRSKGFGFVEMSTEEEAKQAIGRLNGSSHGGRTIIVSEARAETKRTGGSGGRGGAGGNRDRGDRGGWR